MTMPSTLIVNLWGGPGSGKSTVAAETFAKLKWEGVNAELVTEWAKEQFWERPHRTLDPVMCWSEQYNRIQRVVGKVSVAVVDSPQAMSLVYALQQQWFPREAWDVLRALDHSSVKLRDAQGHQQLDVLVRRLKPWQSEGRWQTKAQAEALDVEMRRFLWEHVKGTDEALTDAVLGLDEIDGDEGGVLTLTKRVLEILAAKSDPEK